MLLTRPVPEVDPVMYGRLQAQLESSSIVQPVIMGQVPHQEVGVPEVFLRPTFEYVKKFDHALVVVAVVGVVIMFACGGTCGDTLMEVDFALDQGEKLLEVPCQLFQSDSLGKWLHVCV